MNLKEKLAQKRAELAALKSKIEAGDAEAIKSGENLMNEINDLKDKIALEERKAALLGSIGSAAPGNDGAKDEKPAKSLGAHFVAEVKRAKLKPGVDRHFTVAASDYKAASDVQMSPASAVAFATTYDRNVVTLPRTELVVRDLFGAETISGSALTYLVEGAAEGAPAITAEGAKKAQVHFANPEPKTVALSKIAGFIKESDEYIRDYAFLESAINGRLRYMLSLAEQDQLVAWLLATSGIQTDSTTWTAASTANQLAELILKASLDVQAGSGFRADAIMINPQDWFDLRIAKNGQNDYYGGGFFTAQTVDNLWGFPVCITTAITAGKIVVGAYKTCASVVQNGGVSVDATNSDADDFQKNLMTLRAEERLALAVRRPAGFKVLTKAS